MAESPSELHAEIEKLERKHAEHPEGRYFVPLANAYRKLGDVEHAESLLTEGLRRHPDYLSAHIVFGRCLADRNATRQAEEEFRYVLSLDPQNLIALRTLGELAATDGQTADAERWYDELLAVDPMNEEARRALENIRGTASGPAADEEFRPGAGWWEKEVEEQAEEVNPEAGPLAPITPIAPDDFSDDFITLDEPVAIPAAPEISLDEPIRDLLPLAEEIPLDEPLDDEPDDDSGPVEVVTETIAELYARQGFHERSAEVLRELIRRRGGDPALERRLGEIEAMIAGGATSAEPTVEATPEPAAPPAAQPVAAPPIAAPQLEAAPELDSFATSFSDGFFGADGEDGGGVQAQSTGETIGSYLRALIAWSPSAADPAAQSEPEPIPGPEPIPELELIPEPEPESQWFQQPAPEPEPEPDTDPEAETEPLMEISELAPAEGPAAEAQEPGTGSADADLFPWEMPASTLPEAAPSLPEEVLPEQLPGFDAFFSEVEEQEPTVEDTVPLSPEERAPETAPPAAPEAAPPPAPRPAPAEEDDEDLESFQTWLRSLKR
jgi:tetratricopeptide (TPR) repeat protein